MTASRRRRLVAVLAALMGVFAASLWWAESRRRAVQTRQEAESAELAKRAEEERWEVKRLEDLARASVTNPDESSRKQAALELAAVIRDDPRSARVRAAMRVLLSIASEQAHVDRLLPSYLKQIGAAGVPGLVAALTDRDEAVRKGAASALGRFGPDAKEAVPALV